MPIDSCPKEIHAEINQNAQQAHFPKEYKHCKEEQIHGQEKSLL